jgi:hypothetical protein
MEVGTLDVRPIEVEERRRDVDPLSEYCLLVCRRRGGSAHFFVWRGLVLQGNSEGRFTVLECFERSWGSCVHS